MPTNDNPWQPIATAPINEPIELAEFPHVVHVPNISIAMSKDSMKLAFPKATHWRRVEQFSIAASRLPTTGSASI